MTRAPAKIALAKISLQCYRSLGDRNICPHKHGAAQSCPDTDTDTVSLLALLP